MTNLKIVGDALVITSGITVDQIHTLGNGFKLKDDKENEIFGVTYKAGGEASLNEYGVTFNSANADGKLQATVILPANTADKAGYVREHFFKAIAGLNQLEPVAIQEVEATIAAITATFNGMSVE